MMTQKNLHQNEQGQTALETAIILIAFIVVASVFAFTILSAGSASTEKGEEAIYSGLTGVQSSMSIKGAVIAQEGATADKVDKVVFSVALVSGGDPIDMTDTTGNNAVVISYRDGTQIKNELDWTVTWIGNNDADKLLEEGELAEVTVSLAGLTTTLGANTAFTLEIKPPTGAILSVNRTTPASIEKVNELR